ncbi:MAG: hypothetical protein LBI69_04665 [Puniceicoccales bacterium]|jgi:hypothetical protein|nr:hypothetical protein [Puniceicoccales bacterium]
MSNNLYGINLNMGKVIPQDIFSQANGEEIAEDGKLVREWLDPNVFHREGDLPANEARLSLAAKLFEDFEKSELVRAFGVDGIRAANQVCSALSPTYNNFAETCEELYRDCVELLDHSGSALYRAYRGTEYTLGELFTNDSKNGKLKEVILTEVMKSLFPLKDYNLKNLILPDFIRPDWRTHIIDNSRLSKEFISPDHYLLSVIQRAAAKSRRSSFSATLGLNDPGDGKIVSYQCQTDKNQFTTSYAYMHVEKNSEITIYIAEQNNCIRKIGIPPKNQAIDDEKVNFFLAGCIACRVPSVNSQKNKNQKESKQQKYGVFLQEMQASNIKKSEASSLLVPFSHSFAVDSPMDALENALRIATARHSTSTIDKDTQAQLCRAFGIFSRNKLLEFFKDQHDGKWDEKSLTLFKLGHEALGARMERLCRNCKNDDTLAEAMKPYALSQRERGEFLADPKTQEIFQKTTPSNPINLQSSNSEQVIQELAKKYFDSGTAPMAIKNTYIPLLNYDRIGQSAQYAANLLPPFVKHFEATFPSANEWEGVKNIPYEQRQAMLNQALTLIDFMPIAGDGHDEWYGSASEEDKKIIIKSLAKIAQIIASMPAEGSQASPKSLFVGTKNVEGQIFAEEQLTDLEWAHMISPGIRSRIAMSIEHSRIVSFELLRNSKFISETQRQMMTDTPLNHSFFLTFCKTWQHRNACFEDEAHEQRILSYIQRNAKNGSETLFNFFNINRQFSWENLDAKTSDDFAPQRPTLKFYDTILTEKNSSCGKDAMDALLAMDEEKIPGKDYSYAGSHPGFAFFGEPMASGNSGPMADMRPLLFGAKEGGNNAAAEDDAAFLSAFTQVMSCGVTPRIYRNSASPYLAPRIAIFSGRDGISLLPGGYSNQHETSSRYIESLDSLPPYAEEEDIAFQRKLGSIASSPEVQTIPMLEFLQDNLDILNKPDPEIPPTNPLGGRQATNVQFVESRYRYNLFLEILFRKRPLDLNNQNGEHFSPFDKEIEQHPDELLNALNGLWRQGFSELWYDRPDGMPNVEAACKLLHVFHLTYARFWQRGKKIDPKRYGNAFMRNLVKDRQAIIDGIRAVCGDALTVREYNLLRVAENECLLELLDISASEKNDNLANVSSISKIENDDSISVEKLSTLVANAYFLNGFNREGFPVSYFEAMERAHLRLEILWQKRPDLAKAVAWSAFQKILDSNDAIKGRNVCFDEKAGILFFPNKDNPESKDVDYINLLTLDVCFRGMKISSGFNFAMLKNEDFQRLFPVQPSKIRANDSTFFFDDARLGEVSIQRVIQYKKDAFGNQLNEIESEKFLIFRKDDKGKMWRYVPPADMKSLLPVDYFSGTDFISWVAEDGCMQICDEKNATDVIFESDSNHPPRLKMMNSKDDLYLDFSLQAEQNKDDIFHDFEDRNSMLRLVDSNGSLQMVTFPRYTDSKGNMICFIRYPEDVKKNDPQPRWILENSPKLQLIAHPRLHAVDAIGLPMEEKTFKGNPFASNEKILWLKNIADNGTYHAFLPKISIGYAPDPDEVARHEKLDFEDKYRNPKKYLDAAKKIPSILIEEFEDVSNRKAFWGSSTVGEIIVRSNPLDFEPLDIRPANDVAALRYAHVQLAYDHYDEAMAVLSRFPASSPASTEAVEAYGAIINWFAIGKRYNRPCAVVAAMAMLRLLQSAKPDDAARIIYGLQIANDGDIWKKFCENLFADEDDSRTLMAKDAYGSFAAAEESFLLFQLQILHDRASAELAKENAELTKSERKQRDILEKAHAIWDSYTGSKFIDRQKQLEQRAKEEMAQANQLLKNAHLNLPQTILAPNGTSEVIVAKEFAQNFPDAPGEIGNFEKIKAPELEMPELSHGDKAQFGARFEKILKAFNEEMEVGAKQLNDLWQLQSKPVDKDSLIRIETLKKTVSEQLIISKNAAKNAAKNLVANVYSPASNAHFASHSRRKMTMPELLRIYGYLVAGNTAVALREFQRIHPGFLASDLSNFQCNMESYLSSVIAMRRMSALEKSLGNVLREREGQWQHIWTHESLPLLKALRTEQSDNSAHQLSGNLLLFEYVTRIRPRDDQFEVLLLIIDQICKNPSDETAAKSFGILVQQIMGSGKTKVLLPFLIQQMLLRGNNLPLIISHVTQIPALQFELPALLWNFGIRVEFMNPPFAELRTLEGLRIFYQSLQAAYRLRDRVPVVSSYTALSLMATFDAIAAKEGKLSDEDKCYLQELNELFNFLRTKGISLMDEVHLTLRPTEAFIIQWDAIAGIREQISPSQITFLGNFLRCLPNEARNALRNNQQDQLGKEELREYFKETIQRHFIQQFPLGDNEDLSNELICFVLGDFDGAQSQIPSEEFQQWLKNLTSPQLRETLAMMHMSCSKLLPQCFAKKCGEDYGPNDDGVTVPLHNKKAMTTYYRSPYESITYSILNGIIGGIPPIAVRHLVEKMASQGALETMGEITLDQTTSAQNFLQLFGIDTKNTNHLKLSNAVEMKEIERENSNGTGVLAYEPVIKESALNELMELINLNRKVRWNINIKMALDQADFSSCSNSATPVSLLDLTRASVAFSGTIGNRDAYPNKLGCVHEQKGALGKIAAKFCDDVENGRSKIVTASKKNLTTAKKFLNLWQAGIGDDKERLKKMRLICDHGASLSKQSLPKSIVQIARFIHNSINFHCSDDDQVRFIEYFDARLIPPQFAIATLDDILENGISFTSVPLTNPQLQRPKNPAQLFTFLDSARTVGSDPFLAPWAVGLMLINPFHATSESALQALLRERSFLNENGQTMDVLVEQEGAELFRLCDDEGKINAKKLFARMLFQGNCDDEQQIIQATQLQISGLIRRFAKEKLQELIPKPPNISDDEWLPYCTFCQEMRALFIDVEHYIIDQWTHQRTFLSAHEALDKAWNMAFSQLEQACTRAAERLLNPENKIRLNLSKTDKKILNGEWKQYLDRIPEEWKILTFENREGGDSADAIESSGQQAEIQVQVQMQMQQEIAAAICDWPQLFRGTNYEPKKADHLILPSEPTSGTEYMASSCAATTIGERVAVTADSSVAEADASASEKKKDLLGAAKQFYKSDVQNLWNFSFAKQFHGTPNFFQISNTATGLFHRHRMAAHYLLIAIDPNDATAKPQCYFLSHDDAPYIRKAIEEGKLLNCQLYSSQGHAMATMPQKVDVPEKVQLFVDQACWMAHFFNGDIDYLEKHGALTEYLFGQLGLPPRKNSFEAIQARTKYMQIFHQYLQLSAATQPTVRQFNDIVNKTQATINSMRTLRTGNYVSRKMARALLRIKVSIDIDDVALIKTLEQYPNWNENVICIIAHLPASVYVDSKIIQKRLQEFYHDNHGSDLSSERAAEWLLSYRDVADEEILLQNYETEEMDDSSDESSSKESELLENSRSKDSSEIRKNDEVAFLTNSMHSSSHKTDPCSDIAQLSLQQKIFRAAFITAAVLAIAALTVAILFLSNLLTAPILLSIALAAGGNCIAFTAILLSPALLLSLVGVAFHFAAPAGKTSNQSDQHNSNKHSTPSSSKANLTPSKEISFLDFNDMDKLPLPTFRSIGRRLPSKIQSKKQYESLPLPPIESSTVPWANESSAPREVEQPDTIPPEDEVNAGLTKFIGKLTSITKDAIFKFLFIAHNGRFGDVDLALWNPLRRAFEEFQKNQSLERKAQLLQILNTIPANTNELILAFVKNCNSQGNSGNLLNQWYCPLTRLFEMVNENSAQWHNGIQYLSMEMPTIRPEFAHAVTMRKNKVNYFEWGDEPIGKIFSDQMEKFCKIFGCRASSKTRVLLTMSLPYRDELLSAMCRIMDVTMRCLSDGSMDNLALKDTLNTDGPVSYMRQIMESIMKDLRILNSRGISYFGEEDEIPTGTKTPFGQTQIKQIYNSELEKAVRNLNEWLPGKARIDFDGEIRIKGAGELEPEATTASFCDRLETISQGDFLSTVINEEFIKTLELLSETDNRIVINLFNVALAKKFKGIYYVNHGCFRTIVLANIFGFNGVSFLNNIESNPEFARLAIRKALMGRILGQTRQENPRHDIYALAYAELGKLFTQKGLPSPTYTANVLEGDGQKWTAMSSAGDMTMLEWEAKGISVSEELIQSSIMVQIFNYLAGQIDANGGNVIYNSADKCVRAIDAGCILPPWDLGKNREEFSKNIMEVFKKVISSMALSSEARGKNEKYHEDQAHENAQRIIFKLPPMKQEMYDALAYATSAQEEEKFLKFLKVNQLSNAEISQTKTRFEFIRESLKDVRILDERETLLNLWYENPSPFTAENCWLRALVDGALNVHIYH